MKYLILFEKFNAKNRYKLVSNSVNGVVKSLKWFKSNFDVTGGFVQALAGPDSGWKEGSVIKIEMVEDHTPQFIKKTTSGYEIEIGLTNYDGKLMDNGKWNLDLIHKFMKKDGLDSKIVPYDSSMMESSHYEETSWTVNIDGEDVTVTIKEIEKYLKKANAPVIEIPVKEIFHMCVHKDKKDKETLERSEKSDLKYPIIIAKNKSGKYTMILDGHHRLLKAKNNGVEKIKAQVLDLDKSPSVYQRLFS